jgi:hypothetical protein
LLVIYIISITFIYKFMTPKKKDTGSKGGRPTGAKTTKVGGQVAEADLHPELQSNWMELKPMVFF